PAGRAPRDELAAAGDGPGDVDGPLGDRRGRLRRRDLVLPAGGAGAADGSEWARKARGGPRRADRGADVHETLVVVARGLGRDRLGGELPDAAPPLAAVDLVEPVGARQHARDVPVDDGDGTAEGDRTDGPGG